MHWYCVFGGLYRLGVIAGTKLKFLLGEEKERPIVSLNDEWCFVFIELSCYETITTSSPFRVIFPRFSAYHGTSKTHFSVSEHFPGPAVFVLLK